MKRALSWKTAIPGITALMVVLVIELPGARAEAQTARSLSPEIMESGAGAGAAIRPGENLTVKRCVDIALRNSPDILAASHTVKAAWRRAGQAWSGYYPQITLSGSYSKRNTDRFVLYKQDAYSGSARLTQNIIDFGKTGTEVSIRQKDLDASREDLRDVTGQIVLNVKTAYYGLLEAEKRRDVLSEAVMLFEKQLEEATAFYKAGIRPRFDVTNAEVELGNAKLELIRAENGLRIARVTLNNAMGVPDAPDYTIENNLSFQKYAITFAEAHERAFLNRPDIRSTAAGREAAEESLSLARKGHLPTLSGNAGYERTGEHYPPHEDSWNVGLTLTVPFFTGFLTTHRVGEAKENLSVVKAKEEALRQDVLLKLQQAYLKLLEAEERVGVAELTVKQAEENYELAQGMYEAGLGSPIDETNALVKLSNARTNFVTALADYKVAEAELQRAMGE